MGPSLLYTKISLAGSWRVSLSGQCDKIQRPMCNSASRLTIQCRLMAPEEPKNWDPDLSRLWLGFSNLTGVNFQGSGVIDGSGSKWWAASCKRNRTNVILSIIF
uniref:Uncharacterized protein n=1 Tax=Opuntia streptacantha TaxID=393608 RepID=A0A7C9AVF5_OPUST